MRFLAAFLLLGCAAKKPVTIPPVTYRVYVHPKQCKKQPDRSFDCNHVRLDPQEVKAK